MSALKRDEKRARDIEQGGFVGFMVFSETHGEWCDDWDGTIYTARTEGEAALEECRGAGYRGLLVQCFAVTETGR